eukprot:4638799-Amphidinium_carterae.1
MVLGVGILTCSSLYFEPLWALTVPKAGKTFKKRASRERSTFSTKNQVSCTSSNNMLHPFLLHLKT